MLAAFVARNRDKRAQVVAFQLPENFHPIETQELFLIALLGGFARAAG
jgi:hypothetical protein